ncbi:MAG TPA: polysaccharide deacetylase family protein [Chthonomonadaceae bacterium]|nr:polysaccharide deacetylase family protein [Chthonomonadaceae bacterium]
MAKWEFPEGKSVAVVTSWDNGTATDRIMLRMLEQYGYKGTFYVCPELIGTEGYLNLDDLKQIADAGHEIGSHSLSHPHLENLTAPECQRQVAESKTWLEEKLGTPVESFAYPYGFAQGADWVAEAVRKAGYRSARTTDTVSLITASMLKTGDPMRLPVTAHFSEGFLDVQRKWDEIEASDGGIFHLWGHSHTLGADPHDWVDFECILGFLGGISHVWYGTVGELMAEVLQRR